MTSIESKFPQSTGAFRKLTKETKFKLVLDFCKHNNRTPSVSNVTESERILGQFYINAKTAFKSYRLKKSEVVILEQINTYAKTGGTRLSKIEKIIEFCKNNNRNPIQSSKNKDEQKLGQVLNTLKNRLKHGKLNPIEIEKLKLIAQYRSNHQLTREEKLTEVLDFCKITGRTPRQHVCDKDEKRLAVFLLTIKLHHKSNKLNYECTTLFNEICKYLPSTRLSKLHEILEFGKATKHIPSTNADSPEERKMAIFFAKMKGLYKNNKLALDEADVMKTIFDICSVKNREDKIKELLNYMHMHNRLPKINSNDKTERTFAMFYNNIKQCYKKGNLSTSECDLLERIISYKEINA